MVNMNTNDAAYKKHLSFMKNAKLISDFDEQDLHIQFDNLLSCIPNGGKLYKYRSLRGKAFKYIYDCLKNGYLWVPQAKDLNDDNDTTVTSDALKEIERFVDYLFQDQEKLICVLANRRGSKYWSEDAILNCIPFDSVVCYFDTVSGTVYSENIKSKLRIYHEDSVIEKHYLDFLQRLVMTDFKNDIYGVIEEFIVLNNRLRDFFYIFSMSDSYDLSNMWAYYADSGQGFCIEYDYNLAKKLDPLAKCILLNSYKVVYTNSPQEVLSERLAEVSLFSPNDMELQEKLNYDIFERLLTKEVCWEHEREWRIAFVNNNFNDNSENYDCNRIPVDIVSAIIIDERSLEKTNAKKLIRLCKKRGWTIKIRRRHLYDTAHTYELFYPQETNP